MALISQPLPRLVRCDGTGCENHDSEWCETLARFYTHSTSGATLWARIDEASPDFKLGFKVSIPVFPTWDNMWTEANLTLLPNSTSALVVEALIGEEEVFLGVITRSDHVGTVRSMILDRIKSTSIQVGDGTDTVRAKMWTCKAAAHSFAAESKWQEILKLEPFDLTRLVNIWAIMNESCCMACRASTASWSDPDLIPDDGKKKSIW